MQGPFESCLTSKLGQGPWTQTRIGNALAGPSREVQGWSSSLAQTGIGTWECMQAGPPGRCKAGLIHRHLMSPHARFHARSQHLFQVLSLSTESNFQRLFVAAVTAIHHFFCFKFMQCFAFPDLCANVPCIFPST